MWWRNGLSGAVTKVAEYVTGVAAAASDAATQATKKAISPAHPGLPSPDDRHEPAYSFERDFASPLASEITVQSAPYEKPYRRRTRPRRGGEPAEHDGDEDPGVSILSGVYKALTSYKNKLQRLHGKIVSTISDVAENGVTQQTLDKEMRELSLPKFDSPPPSVERPPVTSSFDRSSSSDQEYKLKELLDRVRFGDSKAIAEASLLVQSMNAQGYDPARVSNPLESPSPSSSVSTPYPSIPSGVTSNVDSRQLPSLTPENLALVNGSRSDAKVSDTAVAEADDSGIEPSPLDDENGSIKGANDIDDTATVISIDSNDSTDSRT